MWRAASIENGINECTKGLPGEVVAPKSTRQIMDQSHRVGVQFLIADLTVALTFLDIADTTHLEESRRRTRENARSAYDTVVRLLPKVSPSDEERSRLNNKLAELRGRLVALGFQIDPDVSSGSMPRQCM